MPGRVRGFGPRLPLVSLMFVLLAMACATIHNTPEQNLAFTRWNRCQTEIPTTQLRFIEQDGRIFFWHRGAWDRFAMMDCLREAGAGGPALPEPLGEEYPGGPG